MIDKVIKDDVIKDRKDGLSLGQISKKYNLSKPTVQSIINNYGKQKHKTGPKDKLSKNDKRRIKSFIDYNFKNQIKCTARSIIDNFSLNISRSTICRFLKTNNFNYDKIKKKLVLSAKHKKDRINAARFYIRENINWNKVVFTDEKKFNLNGCDSQMTWFNKNRSPRRVRKILRSAGVMVWGMILPNGLLSFRIMVGRVNSRQYIQILKDCALPIIKLNMNNDFMFQQDNCSIHVSKESTFFLNSYNIETILWPALSPDLNIMENVWSILSDLIYSDSRPKNIKELVTRIRSAVALINESKKETILNLYNSMPSRICEVLERHGHRIKY